jgi:hypothetical protein
MTLTARIDFPLLLAVGLSMGFLTLPGAVVVRALGLARASSALDRLVLSFVLSLAVVLVPAFVLDLAGASFRAVLLGAIALSAGSGVWLGVRLWRRFWGARPKRPRLVVAAPWLLALAMFVLGLVTTRPFSTTSDVPDHLATIRAIATTNELEPTNVFYAGGDGACRDPRKSFYHAWMAILTSLSRSDPVASWNAARPWLMAMGALAFAALARSLTAGQVAYLVALAAYPLLVHGSSAWFLDTFAYPHNANWILIWSAWMLAASRLGSPSRGGSIALVCVGAALPLLHIFAGVLACAGLLAWPLLFHLQRRRTFARHAWGALGLVAALGAPITVLRLGMTYCPVNPLHTEASEVFYLTRHLTLHTPAQLLARFSGASLFIALLSLVWVRSWKRSDHRRTVVAALTWAPLLVSLNPVAGGLLQPKIGYLFVRFLGIIPFPIVAGWLCADALSRGRRSLGGVLLLLGVAVPSLSRLPSLLAMSSRPSAAEHVDLAALDRGLDVLRRAVPDPRETVLTDPSTSYLLPALTGHRVVTTLDQHSTPGDSTIRGRLEDVARALSPYRPLSEAVEVCRRRGARYVFLNQTFTGTVATYFDTRVPADDRRARARFDMPGSPFRRVGESEACVLYEWSGSERAPFDSSTRRYPASIDPSAFGSVAGEWLAPGYSLVGFSVEPKTLAPGDTLEVRVTVRKDAPDGTAVPYRVVVRGRNRMEGLHERFRAFDRLYARWLGRTGGPVLEFVSVRRPLDGRYPPNLWDVGDIIEDRFSIAIPPAAEPGAYRIGLAWSRERLVRNIALRDWLRPSGGIGMPVGEIEVVRDR